MLLKLIDFLKYAAHLWLLIVRKPARVSELMDQIPLPTCLRFGWLCFFIGTLMSGGYQFVFIKQLLNQISNDPEVSSELANVMSMLGVLQNDWIEKLEIARLLSFATIILAPVTAFIFLHLISGALFVVLKAICLPKNKDGAYDKVMKIVALGQAPVVLCAVPILGPLLGSLWSIWLIARLLGTVFEIGFPLRVGLVTMSFMFLFSFWNSTIHRVVDAYHRKSVEKTVVLNSLSKQTEPGKELF